MEGMRESVSLMVEDEVRGGTAWRSLVFLKESSRESKVCKVSAKCSSAIPRMPRGIKSNIETVVTDTWAGFPWSGGVSV